MDETSQLFLLAAEGDRDALEEFVNRTQAEVHRFCVSMVGGSHADDATQETFVRAWRSAGTFRAESAARTWLFAIARRVCADHHGRARRQSDVATTRRADGGPCDPDGGHGEALALRDLIDRLEPDRRSAFVLTQLHGLSYQQAAEVCGCPIGTIRSRVTRARSALIAAYQDDIADGRP